MALPDYRDGFEGYAQAVATTYEIPQNVMTAALGRTPNIGTTQILDVAESLVNIFSGTRDWSATLSQFTGETVSVTPEGDVVRHTEVQLPPDVKSIEAPVSVDDGNFISRAVDSWFDKLGEFMNNAKYVALITLVIGVLVIGGLYVLIVKNGGGNSA